MNDLATAIEAAWAPWRAAVDRVGVDQFDDGTPAGWTVKELLGHMAFWEEATVGVVALLLRQTELPEGWRFGSGYQPEAEWPAAEVHNAREAAWATGVTADEVLARLDAAHAESLDVVSGFTAAEVADERFRSYVDEKIGHYVEHLPELEAVAGPA